MLAFPYISPDKYTPHCLVVADDDRRRNDEIFITFMVKVNEVNEVAPSGPHESGECPSRPLFARWH